MRPDADPLGEFQAHGVATLPQLIPASTCAALLHALQADTIGVGCAGSRHALAIPALACAALTPPLADLARSLLGSGGAVVAGVLLDKTPSVNWQVPWHRDCTIRVRERLDREGWRGWSEKDGAWQVEPPRMLLERLVALRLHLDDIPADHGALEVQAGSHRDQDAEAHPHAIRTLGGARGTVVAMRPLLLHRSRRCTRPGHRRVLHLTYGPMQPASGMRWQDCLALAAGADQMSPLPGVGSPAS